MINNKQIKIGLSYYFNKYTYKIMNKIKKLFFNKMILRRALCNIRVFLV